MKLNTSFSQRTNNKIVKRPLNISFPFQPSMFKHQISLCALVMVLTLHPSLTRGHLLSSFGDYTNEHINT